MLDKLPVYACLAAAIAVAALGLATRMAPGDLALGLIWSICGFWLLGQGIKLYLKRNVFPASKKDIDAQTSDSHNEMDDL
ncbi:MAG: hypothetical protein LBC41_18020 [Clostridiales bacterium]|jgi:hypothetical protein|nr:hypothetical protein [Clostridiales bacterium]MDR2752556.1 hypothetical protein [Clostridiales bacterium]